MSDVRRRGEQEQVENHHLTVLSQLNIFWCFNSDESILNKEGYVQGLTGNMKTLDQEKLTMKVSEIQFFSLCFLVKMANIL
jgi:hypothetical protein